MLANTSVINIVAECIKRYKCNKYVLDPVMISKSGYNLLEQEAIDALQNKLFPLSTLITPNIYEAQVLSGMEIVTLKDVEVAGNILWILRIHWKYDTRECQQQRSVSQQAKYHRSFYS